MIADEPSWKCPIHGGAIVNRCACGRYMRHEFTHEDLCTLADKAGEQVSIGWLVEDRAEMTVYLKVEAALQERCDLLAALKRSLDWLASYPADAALSVYDEARAAIAKAEGR